MSSIPETRLNESDQRAARETTYKIRDAAGRVVALHERKNKPGGEKDYFWKQPDGTWGLNGTKSADLPLYGSEMHHEWNPDELVILAEGEKARDALNAAGFDAVGTVTGASKTPGEKALEILRDRRVVLWPDTDAPGREHMDRIAERLQDVAAEVTVYTWHDAPEVWVEGKDGKPKLKAQDAADHPAIKSKDPKAIDRLWTDLEDAPRWKPPQPLNPLLEGRYKLARGIAEGIEPPEELEPGVLLKGKVHGIYSGPSTGKTWLTLWLAKRCLERGEPVVFLDMENGPRIVAERLGALKVAADKVDEYLYYIPSPSLTLSPEDRASYAALLDEIDPALVIFDSWINFLAAAGCDENASNDIARWAVAYTHPARNRGSAVVLLDHVPHENNHARGSTRKKDEVDVQWKLHNTKPFDRDSVGEIVLHREKDREAWLPPSVKFSLGGKPDGMLFARSAGTFDEPDNGGLTDNQRRALETLQGFGESGARYKAWKEASTLPSTTFDRVKAALLQRGSVTQAENRYFVRTRNEPRNEPPRGLPLENGSGGSTSGTTPTNPVTGGGSEYGLDTPDSPNPHEPPFNPHTRNGGHGNPNPHNPHPPKGGGCGGKPGGNGVEAVFEDFDAESSPPSQEANGVRYHDPDCGCSWCV